MKKITMQRGMSLVETLIYVAIFSIFVVGLAGFSNSLGSARLHSQVVFEVNDQGSHAIKTITQTLRNAIQVNSPTIGTGGTSLSVVTHSPASSPTVFSESGGVLYVTEGSGSPVALTNNKVVVSNIAFSNLSRPNTPPIIKIHFMLTGISAKDPYSVTFDGSGALRK